MVADRPIAAVQRSHAKRSFDGAIDPKEPLALSLRRLLLTGFPRRIFLVARRFLILLEPCISDLLSDPRGVLARHLLHECLRLLGFLGPRVWRFSAWRRPDSPLCARLHESCVILQLRSARDCRSSDCVWFACAVARNLSDCACFALAAVWRRSTKPVSLRGMSSGFLQRVQYREQLLAFFQECSGYA